MKNNYTVLLFIGAINATQLNTLKRLHQRRNWHDKIDANVTTFSNETQYEADTPAGYGGTANESQSETNVTGVANATTDDTTATAALIARSKHAQRGPQRLNFLQTGHQTRRHQKRSNQELLYMAMRGSTLGAFDETDTADYWKQKQQEHSSDDYVDDTPEAYGWVNAEELQLKANNLMRAPAGWGDLQAAKDDHIDYIKDSQSDHSNNEEYVPDAP